MPGSAKRRRGPITHAQHRELTQLAYADQLTFGAARARVQNNLVRSGFARFLEVDGVGVCRITPAGRAAHGTWRHSEAEAPEDAEDRETELRRRLQSLRRQREATQFELQRLDRRIEEAESDLATVAGDA